VSAAEQRDRKAAAIRGWERIEAAGSAVVGPMKTHSEKHFLQWAAIHRLALDPSSSGSALLEFEPDPGLSRFWLVPVRPELRSYFLFTMLRLTGPWHSCFIWRHMGSWPLDPQPPNANDRVEYQILSGLGLPMGTADVVEFERAEVDKLLAVLFSTTVFAWGVGQDLYVVPDDGRYILKTSHHDVIEVFFRTQADLDRFVEGMAEEGFTLPTAVPDATFSRPDWMTGDGHIPTLPDGAGDH
jgi:hypothetical protein